ncbi:MAG: BON domain-containing protein [Sulfuricella sp.]|nr:BON domain-containing protein [Sulfuricella sp.]
MKKILLLAVLALSPVLQGCVTAVATGVGAGALIAEDRRTTGTYLEDEGIELKAFHRLDEKFGNRVHINTTSFNRHALLTGEVPDQAARDEAEAIVRGIPNVKQVANELQIAGLSSLAERSNDSYLTSKVKIRFIDGRKFSANHVKVVSEGGTVFLMGLVKQREANDAVEITRTTGGVRKVVKVFEYLD